MTRLDIRNKVKSIVGRNFTGIDDVLNNLIDTAVELFSSTVSSIYDEEQWEHTITSAEVSSKIDNWSLPTTAKTLLSATIIEPKSSGDVYYPVEIVSPMDWYDIGKLYIPSVKTSFDYTTETPTFGEHIRQTSSKRVDISGIPRYCTKIGNNLYVYPRPSTREIGWKLRILLAVKPKKLTSDTDTNTITEHYPEALVWYVASLLWLAHLGDRQRGEAFLNTASLLLTSFATQQEISKLIGITQKIAW